MKKMIFFVGIISLIALAGPLWAEPLSGYEAIVAEHATNFSLFNTDRTTNVWGTDDPSLDYSSRATGAGIFSTGMIANVYRPFNQDNQSGGSFISYSKKVSVSGVIDDFHVSFRYKSQHLSPGPHSLFGQFP